MTDRTIDAAAEVETVSTDVLSDGFRRMVRHTIRHRRHDGSWSETITRDLHEGNRVAAVIAYDLEADRLVLLQQFRLAAHLVTGKGVMTEIVAGGVEPDEAADAAARRELHEETGLEVKRIVHCFDYMPSPGITTEIATLFLASVDSTGLPEIAGEDADEDIRPFSMDYDEALRLATGGGTVNGFLLMALNWLTGVGKPAVRSMLEEAD